MAEIRRLPEKIFLCGFMGAGKSTIGKALADDLSLAFADLDDLVEAEAGKSIPEIFREEGEEYFRKLEKDQLLKAARDFEGILALGGGSIQNQHLADHIKLNGLLIFIETPFSVIFDRIKETEGRPLLLNEDDELKDEQVLEKELNELYQNRLPYYRQAEITLHTQKFPSVDDCVDALVKKIRNHVSHY